MRTEDKAQHPSEGMRLIFNQESSMTPRSSRSSSCSSSSSSSDDSSSSSDRSRSPSVSRRSRRLHSHGSRYSSSSSSSSRSRSRSYPRCCRVSDRSCRCRHRRRSRSYSPYPRRSYRYGRRRDSSSSSRSSSRERYYRRSRRSRSRSSSYGRGAYVGRFRCRFSPSPVRYYRRRPKSPECSVRLSQKDKMELLNIARENAAKILGVEAVKLPASIGCFKEAVKHSLEPNTGERVSVDRVASKNPPQGNTTAVEDNELNKPSLASKSIAFSVSNAVAKPSSSPTLTESKVTSRADSVGNRKPYGQWIPVKTVSVKKH